jgi:glycerophosphoryl diester phosphodiesterase
MLSGVHAVQIPERALGGETTTPRLLRAFHAAGVEVHVWTINDPTVMRALLARGVDGIVTDRADLAIEVIGSRES